MSAPLLPVVSAASANALLSDLRPATFQPLALAFINEFLDELLVSIVKASQSINFSDFRRRGVPAVLSESSQGQQRSLGSLGRAAIGEAEVEIRSWYEGHPTARKDSSGFPPDGKGRGLVAAKEKERATFPLPQAIALMRVKAACYSTFAPLPPVSQAIIDQVNVLWVKAGGDASEETVAPAGLWLTAVLEHVCEHIVSKLSQVVARDSSVVTATVHDLYTALCEDDSVYGFFQRMEVKQQIEKHLRAGVRPKRGGPRTASHTSGVTTRTPNDSPHGSHSSLPPPPELPHPTHSRFSSATSSTTRPASEQFYKSVINAAKSVPTVSNHQKRASSVLSSRQTSEDDTTSKRHSSEKAEEDFDAILRSGETMRVSLTPSRFSTFETSPNTSPPRRDSRQTSDHLSAPMSSSESSLLSMSTQASTAESRLSGHRAAAGRSWSSQQTKLIPRGATIEEKDEDDVVGQSVMELLKSEPRSVTAAVEPRSVPAVILKTPPPQAEGQTHDGRGLNSEASQRTLRCASEEAVPVPEHDVNAATHRQRHMSERFPSRELAKFLSTTAPPQAPQVAVSPLPETTSKGSKPRFKSIMSRMGSTKRHTTHSTNDDSFRAWAERTLLPSPSFNALRATSPQDGSSTSVRSPARASSITSTSTLHAHTAPSIDSQQDAASHVTPRELLRKPSLVRKWAAQVTTGDHPSRGLSRRRSTPLNISSPLPEVAREEQQENLKYSGGPEVSSPRPNVGLGLGFGNGLSMLPNIPASESLLVSRDYDFSPEPPRQNGAGTPEAALATLTAGSKSSLKSRSGEDKTPSRRPVMHLFDEPVGANGRASPSPLTSPVRTSSLPPSASQQTVQPVGLRHGRVAELRDDDDGPALNGHGTPGSPTASTRSLPSPSCSPVAVKRALPTASPSSSWTTAPRQGSSRAFPTQTHTPSARATSIHAADGYIALTDLAPMRTLLDHATTARECQLLLDAILSQLGVPRGSATQGEDNVASWLLSGSALTTAPAAGTSWTGAISRRAPPPPSPQHSTKSARSHHSSKSAASAGSRKSTKSSSRRTKLSSEIMMKSLPALPQTFDNAEACDIDDKRASTVSAGPAISSAAPAPAASPAPVTSNGHAQPRAAKEAAREEEEAEQGAAAQNALPAPAPVLTTA